MIVDDDDYFFFFTLEGGGKRYKPLVAAAIAKESLYLFFSFSRLIGIGENEANRGPCPPDRFCLEG